MSQGDLGAALDLVPGQGLFSAPWGPVPATGLLPLRFQKEETQCLLEHLLCALGFFPPPNLAEKGLDAAVAGMFSTKGLQGCCGRRRPVCSSSAACSALLPIRLCSLSRLESHAVLMRAWPPVRGGSAAVHLINNLTLQFFRVNAAILFLTNWKRLVKL